MIKGEDYPGITVVYFCHDGNGNFLMQKRGRNCRDEKGNWDIGSGGLEFGENVEDRLRKEVEEEYSTEILEHKFLGYRDIQRQNKGKPTHWVSLDFKVLVDREKSGNEEPDKIDTIGWFDLNNMPFPLHSQLKFFIKKYREKLFNYGY